MTEEKKARLKELQEMHNLAFVSAKYLNKKAEDCQEESHRALYLRWWFLRPITKTVFFQHL